MIGWLRSNLIFIVAGLSVFFTLSSEERFDDNFGYWVTTFIGSFGMFLILYVTVDLILKVTGIYKLFAVLLNKQTVSLLRSFGLGDDSIRKIISVRNRPRDLQINIDDIHEISDINLGGLSSESFSTFHRNIYENVFEDEKGESKTKNPSEINASDYLYHNAYFRDKNVISIISKFLLNTK